MTRLSAGAPPIGRVVQGAAPGIFLPAPLALAGTLRVRGARAKKTRSATGEPLENCRRAADDLSVIFRFASPAQ